MDLKEDFAFVPRPPLSPFSRVPSDAPLPSATIWSPQPHPAPTEPVAPAEPAQAGATQSNSSAPTQAAPATAAGPDATKADDAPAAAPADGATAAEAPPAAAASVPKPVGVEAPPAAPAEVVAVKPADEVRSANSLGPLASLLGRWSGTGLNVIWRPNNGTGSDHFLEINLTKEDIEFVEIPGDIPNRGLLQGDISMRGLRYLQQIKDANGGQGLHIEPGLWALVPPTVNPLEVETVVRMASIPHGTTVLAQGTASTAASGPTITPVSITPFVIAQPNQTVQFGETDLRTPSPFRTPDDQMTGVAQSMLDNPNSLLVAKTAGLAFKSTTQINVSSAPVPVLGGGVANTAFLNGGVSGPNAQAALVTSSFWIEEVAGEGGDDFLQLQYSQTVMLNFAGLSWPHVSVATLRKAV